jgi:hypothetical protein
LILWPTKKQWDLWSLPSKLTAIGTLLGLLALCFYFIEKAVIMFEWSFTPKPEIHVDLQFPYERSGILVKQNTK